MPKKADADAEVDAALEAAYMADVEAALDEAAKELEFADPWSPEEPGDTIVGTVVSFRRDVMVPTQNGDDRAASILTIQKVNSEVKVSVWDSASLKPQFEMNAAALSKPGTRVAIRYKGLAEKKRKGRNAAKLYVLAILK